MTSSNCPHPPRRLPHISRPFKILTPRKNSENVAQKNLDKTVNFSFLGYVSIVSIYFQIVLEARDCIFGKIDAGKPQKARV